jgi:acetyl-CoA carboxylase biotin carboxyl carrier protein
MTETDAPKSAAPVAASAAPAAAQPAVQSAPAAPAAECAQPAAAPAEVVTEGEGVFVIKSPSYGLFYAQSEPGAAPYVKLGDSVKAGDTVGLVEIMKTFTAITSDVSGTVVGIHVKNEQMLEPDQPLFSIQVS